MVISDTGEIRQAAALEAVKREVGNGDAARGEQELLLLFEYESRQRTQKEISKRLGITQPAVSKRLNKVKQVLERWQLR